MYMGGWVGGCLRDMYCGTCMCCMCVCVCVCVCMCVFLSVYVSVCAFVCVHLFSYAIWKAEHIAMCCQVVQIFIKKNVFHEMFL